MKVALKIARLDEMSFVNLTVALLDVSNGQMSSFVYVKT